MTNSLKTADVVLVDLGYAAKVRPCVVLAPRPDSKRDLAIVAPLTTKPRGGETEIAFPKPRWLHQPSVLNLSGIAGVDHAKIERQIGTFPPDKMKEVKAVLAKMLGLEQAPIQPAA